MPYATSALSHKNIKNKDTVRLEQKIYLHGFPKAGLHLTEKFVQGLAVPIRDFLWFGNNRGAWTMERINLESYDMIFKHFPAGGYVKGHCAHTFPIARTLWENKICTIFVYRDLRDVAISAAHHVLDTRTSDDGDHLKHPGKHLYQALPNFESVLLAIIHGIDDYPGLIPRWTEYAPWLAEKWVLSLRFEDLRYQTQASAEKIARYVIGQTASYANLSVSLSKSGLDSLTAPMVANVNSRKSATFRKGKSGSWRKHWSDKVDKAFDQTGGYDELRRLGYEVD